MFKFETESGSTYEVDPNEKRVRRLAGSRVPTARFGEDGEWRRFTAMLPVEVGAHAVVLWSQVGDKYEITTTSAVTRVVGELKSPLYGHFLLGGGGATVAAEIVDGSTYGAAVAFCSPKDQYDRKRGRAIASGRLTRGGEFLFDVAPGANAADAMRRAFLDWLERDDGLPRWLIRAAERAWGDVWVTSRAMALVGRARVAHYTDE